MISYIIINAIDESYLFISNTFYVLVFKFLSLDSVPSSLFLSLPEDVPEY